MARLIKIPTLFVLAICCHCGCTQSVPQHGGDDALLSTDGDQHAETSDTKEDSRKVIAKVLGREIVASDLVRPASDANQVNDAESQRQRQEMLHQLIWQPLMEKYCADHELQPTEQEIDQYGEAWGTDLFRDEEYLQELRTAAESDELTDEQKRDLSEQVKLLEADGPETGIQRLIRYCRSKLERELSEKEKRHYKETLALLEVEQELPELQIKWWKFNRAAYGQYGGVVIFQQSNPFEPVGAYRKWLEHHEEAGDFEILDAKARAAFWDYYKSDWESYPLGGS